METALHTIEIVYTMATSPVAEGASSQGITSPGPLHMSDLDSSLPVAPHPRKLEPLEPPKRRKKRRTKKREPLSTPEPTSESLLGETLRSQLRSRLDPIYNPAPPSHHHTPHTLSHQSDSVEGVVTPTHSPDRGARKLGPVAIATEEGNLSEEEGPLSQVSPGVRETISGDEQFAGRQLPALPPDAEDPQQPTMADQLGSPRDAPTSTNLQTFLSDEDVIDVEGEDHHMTHTITLPHPHTHTTHRDNVVYVERKDGRGFVAQRRGQVESLRREEGAWLSWVDKEVTSGQITLFVHGIVQRLSITAHGLLAGLCLWDCVVVHVLAGQSDRHVGLLTMYSSLSLPIHSVYLFLLLLVTVSLCDRLDLASFNRICLRNFCNPPTQLFVLFALLLVGVALVLTVSVAAIDERIALYPQLPTLWLDILEPMNASLSPLPVPTTHTTTSLVYTAGSNPVSSLVTSWLGVITVRAVLCCTSWLLAVWVTGTDRLEDYLKGISESRDSRKIS